MGKIKSWLSKNFNLMNKLEKTILFTPVVGLFIALLFALTVIINKKEQATIIVGSVFLCTIALLVLLIIIPLKIREPQSFGIITLLLTIVIWGLAILGIVERIQYVLIIKGKLESTKKWVYSIRDFNIGIESIGGYVKWKEKKFESETMDFPEMKIKIHGYRRGTTKRNIITGKRIWEDFELHSAIEERKNRPISFNIDIELPYYYAGKEVKGKILFTIVYPVRVTWLTYTIIQSTVECPLDVKIPKDIEQYPVWDILVLIIFFILGPTLLLIFIESIRCPRF